MVHWADNYATVGRIRIMSTSVTETRMKSAVKIPARKTNNQATFGGSILKNNMEVEAAMELSRHLDETGLHIVYKTYTSKLKVYILKKWSLSKHSFSHEKVCSIILFTQCSVKVHKTLSNFSWFACNLHYVYTPTGFFLGKTPCW